MYGIESVVPATLGLPIKKPWRIATNSPIIGRAFSVRCCGHPIHAPCQGKDTSHTEGYSQVFAYTFHKALRAHCKVLYRVPAAPVIRRALSCIGSFSAVDQHAIADYGTQASGSFSSLPSAMASSSSSGAPGDPNATAVGVGELAGADTVAEGEPTLVPEPMDIAVRRPPETRR